MQTWIGPGIVRLATRVSCNVQTNPIGQPAELFPRLLFGTVIAGIGPI